MLATITLLSASKNVPTFLECDSCKHALREFRSVSQLHDKHRNGGKHY